MHEGERDAHERVEEERRGIWYVSADLGDFAQWGEEQGTDAVAESEVEHRSAPVLHETQLLTFEPSEPRQVWL